jgi:hypothetical protein
MCPKEATLGQRGTFDRNSIELKPISLSGRGHKSLQGRSRMI